MLYRQRSSFFYEMRIKPLKKISPFRKRASEPGRTQKTKYAAVSRIPSEVADGRRVQGSVKRNVFVKPNEQSRACASYAMARKRLLKTNHFVKPNAEPNEVRAMPRREMEERNSRIFVSGGIHETGEYPRCGYSPVFAYSGLGTTSRSPCRWPENLRL